MPEQTPAPPPEAVGPHGPIVGGFHVVEFADGHCDVGFFPNMSAKSLLMLLGVATIKVQDEIRGWMSAAESKDKNPVAFDSPWNRAKRRLFGGKKMRKQAAATITDLPAPPAPASPVEVVVATAAK